MKHFFPTIHDGRVKGFSNSYKQCRCRKFHKSSQLESFSGTMKIMKKVFCEPCSRVSKLKISVTMFSTLLIAAILISMLFGLFPISGLFTKDPHRITFKWMSLHTLFSGCFIVSSLGYTLLSLHNQVRSGPLTPSNIVGIIFFISCCTISILFFKLAMNFGKIMQRWSEVERSLEKTSFREAVISTRWSLRKRVNVCLTVSVIFAAVEHTLSLITAYTGMDYDRKFCNWTIKNEFEYFVTRQMYFTFTVFEYDHFKAIIAEYLNISFTFFWSFLDIFIMIISMGLSYNYEKINNRLKFFKERVVQDEVWHEVRKDYNEVSSLIKFVDSHLDSMIILASLNDSYFILLQLLNATS